uniref:Uncharacterized protein n=1 Tax=Glossina austeni TaxID=7395 RepID=A0A1A9V1R0_GLOAU
MDEVSSCINEGMVVCIFDLGHQHPLINLTRHSTCFSTFCVSVYRTQHSAIDAWKQTVLELLLVWFQNSRAKDKKSRNQQRQLQQRQLSNVADNNTDSNTVNLQNKTSKSFFPIVNTTEINSSIVSDCRLCELPQVNIQQHAFTIGHIQKVKELLTQPETSAAEKTVTNNKVNTDKSRADYESDAAETLTKSSSHHQPLALMVLALNSKPNETMLACIAKKSAVGTELPKNCSSLNERNVIPEQPNLVGMQTNTSIACDFEFISGVYSNVDRRNINSDEHNRDLINKNVLSGGIRADETVDINTIGYGNNNVTK